MDNGKEGKKSKTACYLSTKEILAEAMYDIAQALQRSTINDIKELKYILTKLDSSHFNDKLYTFFMYTKIIRTATALSAIINEYPNYP